MLSIARTLGLILLSSAVACSGDGNGNPDGGANNNNDGGGNNNTNASCPSESRLLVCDLKVEGGESQPALGDVISLPEVRVTAGPFVLEDDDITGDPSLYAVYVEDTVSSAELGRRFSGIQVTYRPDINRQPAVGEVVSIEGSYRDFGQDNFQKQFQVQATFIGDSVRTDAVEVLDVASPADLVNNSAAYDGLVVRVSNVAATQTRDVMGPGGTSLFGAFIVTGDLYISGDFVRFGPVFDNDVFTSITGVFRIGTAPFNAGYPLLTPRTLPELDFEQSLNSVVQVQNPADPNYVAPCADTMSLCPRVDLKDMTVTAVGGFLSSGQDGAPNLLAIWVQDMSITDGRYAGVLIPIREDRIGPYAVGQTVNIAARSREFFGASQLSSVTIDIVNTSSASAPAAIQIANPMDLAGTTDGTNPYEGVLVEISGASVTEACSPANNDRDFGNWSVSGGVFMGSAFFYDYNGGIATDSTCANPTRMDDMRMVGDTFSTLRGVMNYSFNVLRLEPRSNADIIR